MEYATRDKAFLKIFLIVQATTLAIIPIITRNLSQTVTTFRTDVKVVFEFYRLNL
ncbi:MAG: hypothetical protein ABSD41_04950 [Candidatus Bathyarchaeia archaeon]|jgi:hypothetical protein